MTEEPRIRLDPTQTCRIHLCSAGVSVLLDISSASLPWIVHWGAALPGLKAAEAASLVAVAVPHRTGNGQDLPVRLDVMASPHAGWSGRPGLVGDRDSTAWTPLFKITEVHLEPLEPLEPLEAVDPQEGVTDSTLTSVGAGTLFVTAEDPASSLRLAIELELTRSGLLRGRATLTNTASRRYRVQELGLVLPLPAQAREILDFAGHWGKERVPQRRELTVGTHLREGRKGRTGADAAHVLTVGEPGFGFAEGEVWGLHTGFSGNHRTWAERLFDGQQVLGGSELLLPGEVSLARGQSYTTPWLYGAYGRGLDEQAARFHDWLRSRPHHPVRPRPVTLNVWEAVYFDHRLEKLAALADRAAAVGVERYVLDDGWFGDRRDDTAGLGDWVVSADVWPEGLSPLIDHVTGLGMEFGLWFEPEMVNPDSAVARAHPEWIMAPGDRLPTEARSQQVLNLGVPEAYAHVRDQMVALLEEYPVAYIKWDHNRDLLEAGTRPDGRPGVHAQTLAAYRLMAELKEGHPDLEIESCSSGGARVDLGVLEHADRVWTSDDIDPFERQQMHRWTQQLIPPELMGAHVASGVSHSTGRTHTLHFRAGTAVWGHLGIEWDLTQADEQESTELLEWVSFHKDHRRLLHTGRVIRLDAVDPALQMHGVVRADRREALFAIIGAALPDVEPIGRLRLRGLEPEFSYRVQDVTPGAAPHGFRRPPWWPEEQGAVLSGRVLQTVGVHAPWLAPDTLRILHLDATPG
ncbi:alpha-galactosidase [Nesterenkonia lutea]|uniref:alpha-galactosidase n=1 Tax=Nesterenkonia lutea TaxID=272919 RepID=A0ABR9JC54_9MICC|nr:alpha-galactosidase [Nesterenkonia lutea]MBE1523363.1 alpha-galactosidase [Nesterenkonia lutea]